MEALGVDFKGSEANVFEIFKCFRACCLEAVPPIIPPAIPPVILASGRQESPRMAKNRPVPRMPKTPRTPRVKIASPERPDAKGGGGGGDPPGDCNHGSPVVSIGMVAISSSCYCLLSNLVST